jgi:hypothetical protein
MASKLSNLTFTDENDIIPASAVEQILNTEVANTLADDDIIIGTGNDYDFENVSVLSTDDGNDDTITGIENLEPEFDSSYDLVNSGTLNADEDNDILTGTSRNDDIINSGRLNADKDHDILTGTTSSKYGQMIKSLTIHSIKCLRANADNIGPDDTYINVNNLKIWGDYNMKRGRTRSVNFDYRSSFPRAVKVELFDCDGGWGRDDPMGGFYVGTTRGKVMKKQVQGSGSSYEVYYSAW